MGWKDFKRCWFSDTLVPNPDEGREEKRSTKTRAGTADLTSISLSPHRAAGSDVRMDRLAQTCLFDSDSLPPWPLAGGRGLGIPRGLTAHALTS